MRNAGLRCFGAGLLCGGKKLFHDIPALGLEFVSSINTFPELFLLFCPIVAWLIFSCLALPAGRAQTGKAANCVVFLIPCIFQLSIYSFVFLPCFPFFVSS
jgi:hypothetical protein